MFVFFTMSFFPLHISLITNEDRLSVCPFICSSKLLSQYIISMCGHLLGSATYFFTNLLLFSKEKNVLLPLAELEGNLYFIILNAFPPTFPSISPIGLLFSIVSLAVYYFSIACFRSTNAKFSCILARHMRPLIPT